MRYSAESQVPGQRNAEEDEVRGDPVPDEPGDHTGGSALLLCQFSVHPARAAQEIPVTPPRQGTAASGEPAIRTRIPSATMDGGETTSRSPA